MPMKEVVIMQGVLHVHSENSLHDCALRIGDICRKAKEKGYDAIALTDNGNMTGIAEFVSVAVKQGLKPVPGVEMYIREKAGTCRLVLMAKDYTGYVGLCKAVSEANRHIEGGIPLSKWEGIMCLFGPDMPYHGHVIATSSGIDGPIARAACRHLDMREEAETVRKEIERLSGIEGSISEKAALLSDIENELESLRAEKKECEKKSKASFVKKEEKLKALEGTPEYMEQWKKLEEEKTACMIAGKKASSLKSRISRRRTKAEKLRKEIDEDTRQLDNMK